MAICGPKLSLAGCIISAWGIVQLVSFLHKKYSYSCIQNGVNSVTCNVYIKIFHLNFQSLMGIFFWIHSVALVEDLNIDEEKISSKGEYVNAMEASYNQVSQTK